VGEAKAGEPVTVPSSIATERLLLRRWTSADLAPFAAMNADPAVMEHFPSTMTREESDQFVSERIAKHFDEHGYGLWAVERSDLHEFVGFVGLMWQRFDASFTPALEVGWRLSRPNWGQGFATEAATEALRIGFTDLSIDEIVSMTSPRNTRSIAVMERLGMSRNPSDDFDHPRVPVGSPLRRHVLYRLTASEWRHHANVRADG